MLGAVHLAGDDVLDFECLRAAERCIGDDVERHQRATVPAEGFQRLRRNEDADVAR